MENRRATVLHSLFSKTSGHQSAALLLANDLQPLHHTLSAAVSAHEVDTSGEAGDVELGYPRAGIDGSTHHVVDLEQFRLLLIVCKEHALARWVRP